MFYMKPQWQSIHIHPPCPFSKNHPTSSIHTYIYIYPYPYPPFLSELSTIPGRSDRLKLRSDRGGTPASNYSDELLQGETSTAWWNSVRAGIVEQE